MQIRDMQRMVAFLPIDKTGIGQCVQLYFRDGETSVAAVGLRSFLQQLAKLYLLNLSEMRKRLGPIIGCKNLVPLALSPIIIFVPLKTRVPSVKGDCAYGYFKLRSLLEVLAKPAPSTLILKGGHRLTIKQSYRLVCRRLRLARKLENYLFTQYYEAMEGERHNIYFFSQNEKRV
ncbi:MAG TPA: hypothetical protein VFC74_07165 [Oscillospiraceae bacterium]|nr:hypothetical protein [Oscillospiraceae bacterium]